MTTNDETWRLPVNTVAYGLIFQRDLTDELAAQHAQGLIEQPARPLTNQEQYDALAYAIESGDDLARTCSGVHSEAEIREFLATVLQEMDRLRPWPESLRVLDIREWQRFENADSIGAVTLPIIHLEGCLQAGFDTAPDDDRCVCLLRLRTGVEIALADNWWPGSSDVAILTNSAEAPTDLIDELITATRLEAEHVQPLQ